MSVRVRIGRRGGQNLVGLSRANRTRLGVEHGQAYDVDIVLDEAPREVEVPAALGTALTRAKVTAAFEAQSCTLRKEQARTVAEARKDETRDLRIARIVALLQA